MTVLWWLQGHGLSAGILSESTENNENCLTLVEYKFGKEAFCDDDDF